ncbi:hypothetical protein [Serratia symbiotica]|uniref:Uncharacterized protein n=1 Tax=Serratia symbiotica TaxID=138074 RepID=A0A068Z412_9GAMM|nr:hypothetical protein [Serratia symbiotica]QLH61942.1 hypothetical protein SYMBAF_01920 [Serratia symbiotica]CDS56927.1 conserved hypothetical protein [Serratia symbiotica]
MSKSGFDADDLSITLARFVGKRRNIVYDEAKLKCKALEPLEFSSATNACGAAILAGIADVLTTSPERKKQNEEWSESWEAEREDWENQDRQWNDIR